MWFQMLACVVAFGLVAPALALPPFPPEIYKVDHQRAEAVKSVFRASWVGYYKYAFPNDTLHPQSNTYENDRNGWGATAIDALSTAIIMGEVKTVNEILERVPQIRFDTTAVENEGISVFETTIRYLGGMLAGYDLLMGPYRHLDVDRRQVRSLLKQARVLADSLKVAFDTNSGIPDPTVYLNPVSRHSHQDKNNIAEIGSLVLEWTRLSDLLDKPEYGWLAQRAESYLINPTGSPEAFPGLVGTFVSTKNGTFLDSNGGWSALDDSFYEYLIKMYLYHPERFGDYKERWILAADSTMKHLASHPTSRSDLTFLSQFNGKRTLPFSGHLASFAGGNFIFGGVMLNSPLHIDFGVNLTVSYFETYKATASGIGPEGFQWTDAALPLGGDNLLPPENKTLFYDKGGFWITSGAYILRPETMESLYYAYRVTGDTKFQDMAWEGFKAISWVCQAGSAYSAIKDVDESDGGGFYDDMESFFLAETLKYLYLIFSEDSEVQFQRRVMDNHFVFNTEAQPLRLFRGEL